MFFFFWPPWEVGAHKALAFTLHGLAYFCPRLMPRDCARIARDWLGYSNRLSPKQQQDGKALQWASEEMKGDRELCMAAVAQNGRACWRALQHASQEMKGDRELCMAAVTENGSAFIHASQEMRKNQDIITLAVQSGRRIHHWSDE